MFLWFGGVRTAALCLTKATPTNNHLESVSESFSVTLTQTDIVAALYGSSRATWVTSHHHVKTKCILQMQDGWQHKQSGLKFSVFINVKWKTGREGRKILFSSVIRKIIFHNYGRRFGPHLKNYIYLYIKIYISILLQVRFDVIIVFHN